MQRLLFSHVVVVVASLVIARSTAAAPVLARPDLFRVEKFAEFTLPPLAAFGLALSDGLNGFPTGLLVSTGPLPDRDKLLFVDPSGHTSVFASGFRSNETVIFGRGAYGTGLLVSEIADGKVTRVLADASRSDFSTDFTSSSVGYGPAQVAFGPDPTGVFSEVLYATDFASGNIMRVNPDGTGSVFSYVAAQSKGIASASALYGGGFIASTFNFMTVPYTGKIFHVSADGSTVTTITEGVTGLQLLANGDALAFQGPLFDPISDLVDERVFVPSIGLGASHDGNVSILNPDGTLSPFLSGIDASGMVFDTSGVLGGGMFVTDVDGLHGEQTIYHITAVPEPSSPLLLGVGMVCAWRRLRP